LALPDFSLGVFWASVAVNAVTRVGIAGANAARKKVITRLIFRVRISSSLFAPVWANGSVLEAVTAALIAS
jgi:hypothetical protein